MDVNWRKLAIHRAIFISLFYSIYFIYLFVFISRLFLHCLQLALTKSKEKTRPYNLVRQQKETLVKQRL